MAVKIVYSYQPYEINISRQRALISTRCDSWRHARCLVVDDVGGIMATKLQQYQRMGNDDLKDEKSKLLRTQVFQRQ